MEATDIRKLDGKRLPARPDVVVIDVSFISLKAVLPVALSLAAARAELSRSGARAARTMWHAVVRDRDRWVRGGARLRGARAGHERE